ncbi:MAG: HlyD family type I secretion periplasmic adaptor subunit [Mesorhizobium sp.]
MTTVTNGKIAPSAVRSASRSREDQEFLPAALELLETPPSPVRMTMILFVAVLTVSAIAWMYLGKFDIVASAQGKVQPAGRVKIIQSVVLGKLVSAPVPNGSVIEAGDVVARLDDTEVAAEQKSAALGLELWQAEKIRRQAFLDMLNILPRSGPWSPLPENAKAQPDFPLGIARETASRERHIFQVDHRELVSTLVGLLAQRAQHLAERVGLARAIDARKALVDTLKERVGMRTTLAETRTGSRASVIDAIEVRQKEEVELAELQGRLQEAGAAILVTDKEATKSIEAVIAEQLRRLAEADRPIDELQQLLIKAQSRRNLTEIRSPIDGTVQASALTTPGQVVEPGVELMRMVSRDADLEIEAYLPNRDIGFVAVGQSAVIKVEAFPFTRYGTIPAKVMRVSTDAILELDAKEIEQSASKELQSIVPIGNAQRVQNLVFPITVRPLLTQLDVDGQMVPISAGMSVTVEIKTGERRILEYLFSPIAEVSS